MMNILQSIIAVGTAAAACCIMPLHGEDLAKTFAQPPETAGPQTWWHWMNGNITREGITADLEAMKKVGIHGAEIFNVEEGIPLGDAPFMSPQWLDLFRHAASEADRLGMELCFHNCAGWSSSGGPWIKPEHAMQTLVTSETRVKGGARVEVTLPQPPTKENYYRDVAILAFPAPSNPARIEKLDAKGSFGFAVEYGMQPDLKIAPAGAVIPGAKIINLTDKMSAGGKLVWDAPEGDWIVLRVGHTPTGKTNHPAPRAGTGLECDKLSREALDAHWQSGIEPILKKLGPLAGKSLNNCLIDSYEVGCNNWTPKFRDEFIKRRGYDPIPWLPVLSGRFVESGEMSERFLWDFRRTIGDLFAENYFGYFCDLCREHGLMSSIEPYDGPFECLQVGAKASIVMGEFWAGGGESSSVKLAGSVAHTHGIKIVGAESFTADPDNGRWLNHPGSLKALGDLTWCTGVNRFIFHCYAHQPWMDKVPGMTMGQWGTHFGRFNTWWEQSRPWIRYITRSQYLLQSGRNVADVLFFGGEASPNGGPHRPDLKHRGFDYDAVGTDLIYQLKVDADNRIVTPAGGRYRLLVMPETEWMTPELAAKVGELVRSGATVLAPKPLKSPSRRDYPACDDQVAKLADEIWGGTPVEHTVGKGRIIPNRSVEDVLTAIKLAPDCVATTPGAIIAFIHRKIDDADVYFVSNQRGVPQTITCAFRVSGRQPELWNAETGSTEPAPLWNCQDGTTTVTLHLEQSGSVFVVFRSPAAAPADPVVQLTAQPSKPSPFKLPKLEIRRAVYGAFTLSGLGLVDVTSKLENAVQDNRLDIVLGNQLAGDPALNVIKEARVQYECDGKTNTLTLPENTRLVLPRNGETGRLRVMRAVYGKFPTGVKEFPPLRSIDITSQVAGEVHDGLLHVVIDNKLAGSDPANMTPKTLRLDYAIDGEVQSAEFPEHTEISLPEGVGNLLPPEAFLAVRKGQLTLNTPVAGRFTLTKKSGATTPITVENVADPVEVDGAWKVTFQPGRGAPAEAVFDNLVSWTIRPEKGINYFSGTATYHKTLSIPASMLGEGKSLDLDLGRVGIIAEVRLNGQELGTLWKAPFRLDISRAAKAGDNKLEIRVINLWVNRLIGDEQLPEDCEWHGVTLKQWPDWMLKGQPRPTAERVTFTTWKHWQRASKLQTSGLLGPVTLRPWVSVPVK
jgi:hypothetical protein